MKNALLASIIGSGIAVTVAGNHLGLGPAIVTKPYSWTCTPTAAGTPMPAQSVDLIVTDIVGDGYGVVTMYVNRTPVASLRQYVSSSYNSGSAGSATHVTTENLSLQSGIFVPAGSLVTLGGTSSFATLTGYLQ